MTKWYLSQYKQNSVVFLEFVLDIAGSLTAAVSEKTDGRNSLTETDIVTTV